MCAYTDAKVSIFFCLLIKETYYIMNFFVIMKFL